MGIDVELKRERAAWGMSVIDKLRNGWKLEPYLIDRNRGYVAYQITNGIQSYKVRRDVTKKILPFCYMTPKGEWLWRGI